MASSSQRGAARAPPPPEEVTAFFTLIERMATTVALSRHARCAELCDRAAKHAEMLYGDNSLVVADLRVNEVISLRNVAFASTSSPEQEALLVRAREILSPVHALLLRRLADNTLLPGTINEEEVAYGARVLAFTLKAKEEPVPSEAALQDLGVVFGYEALLKAVLITLAMQWESAHSFVLLALDAIPRTARMQHRLQNEAALVGFI